MRRDAKEPGSGARLHAYGDARSSALQARFHCVVFALLALVFLSLAPSALAATKYVPVTQFPPGYPENLEWTPSSFGTLLAESVAISQKNHHIYVADSNRGAIFEYSSTSDKVAVRWGGTNTPSGSFGGQHVSVAIDNTTGDVYVADRAHAVVDKFDESGNLIESFGDSTPSQNGQLSGAATPAGSFVPPGSSYSSFPIAVDQANHDLYVADPGHKVVDVFDENGAYVRQITATPEGLYTEGGEYTTGIAVAAGTGKVYLSDWGGHEIYEFDSSGNYVSSWNGSTLPNGSASETPDGNFGEGGSPLEVALDDSTGNVFVNNWGHRTVDIFDEDGNFLPPQISNAVLGGNWLYDIEGITIDPTNHYVYASPNGGGVQVFKPVIVPDVSFKPATDITTTSATISGHVDPASAEGGGPITECRFEYLSDWEFAENQETNLWHGAKRVPCSPEPSNSPADVSATVTGLSPGADYHYRVFAANAEGSNAVAGPVFATNGQYGFSTTFGSSGAGDGGLEEPKDVAVDNSSGDIYVADAGNHRVDQFASSGSFIRAFGADVGGSGVDVCANACQAGTPGSEPGQLTTPTFIEVDNSAGPSAGDVYVADTADGIVHKFDSIGNLIASWGAGGTIGFPAKEGTIGGITVDTLGNLWILTDHEPYNWTEFSEDGLSKTVFPTNGEWGDGSRLSLGTPGGSGIEISSTGGWYETQPGGRASTGVYYSNATASEYTFFPMYKPVYGITLANSGLAIDRSVDDLFVDQGNRIDLFPGAECVQAGQGCKPSDTFGTGNLNSASGLAIRPTTALLYAANSGDDNVAVFSSVPRPEVTTGPATNQGSNSATLTGHVDPGAGGQVSDCRFEYVQGPIRNEIQTLSFGGAQAGSFTLSFEGETTKPIPFYVGGYPGGAYYIEHALGELSAIGNEHVKSHGEEGGPYAIEFVGPFEDSNVQQLTVNASGVTPGGATATIETTAEGSGWNSATSLPCSPGTPLSAPAEVSADLTGLSSFASYYYRLVATRSDGENLPRYGRIRSFTPTQGSAPAVGGASVAGVTATAATVGAQINPNHAPTVYRFQYGIDTSYGSQSPTSESIGEDGADHSVSTELSSLKPGTTYHFRVVAINFNGVTEGPDQTFSTPSAPVVLEGTASAITQTTATLHAQVKPGFRPTTFRFEYGTTKAYGSKSDGLAGSDNSIHPVSSALSGLAPETTYHFRILATNELGTSAGGDETFTTESVESAPSPTCKKTYIKRHGKCVKRHHHRRHRRHHHHRRGQ